MNKEVVKLFVRGLNLYMTKTKVDESDKKELMNKSLAEVICHKHQKSPKK